MVLKSARPVIVACTESWQDKWRHLASGGGGGGIRRGMHGELAGQVETCRKGGGGGGEGYVVARRHALSLPTPPPPPPPLLRHVSQGGKHRWMTSTGGQQTLGIPADTITSQVSGPLRFLEDHQPAATAAAAADKHSREPSLDRAWVTAFNLGEQLLQHCELFLDLPWYND